MLLAVAADAQFQPFRKRVDHGHADAVQTARNLVGILVELTPGMQLGHDDLGRRNALFRMDVDGNAAAVIGHGDRVVAVERHPHRIAISRQRFVDGVVDDFVDHVMQARAVIRIADVHAGPLAHGIKAAQDLDGIREIVAVVVRAPLGG